MPLTRPHKLGIAAAIVALLGAGAVRYAQAPVASERLGWENLVPPGEPTVNPLTGLVYDRITPESVPADPRALQPKQARMVDGLDGRQVSIAGYVVPLEFDGTRVKQFLLVPYYGACIHVPPPPANQIVLVRLERGVEVGADFIPVVVTGRMRVASVATNLADVGYQMAARDVTAYQ